MTSNDTQETTGATVDTNAPTTTTAEAKTRAEAEASQRKADREARKAEKLAAKEKAAKDLAERRANGVIGTLSQALATPQGTTRKEILAVLTAKFPGRDPFGMNTTVGIQLSRLSKTRPVVNFEVPDRGRVYVYADVPDRVTGTAKPAQATQAPAAEVTQAPAQETKPSAAVPSGRDALKALQGGNKNKSSKDKGSAKGKGSAKDRVNGRSGSRK